MPHDTEGKAKQMQNHEAGEDMEISLIIADAMTLSLERARTAHEKQWANDNTKKVGDYLKSCRELRHDESAAAKLLRNPCNFETLIEAFEASGETSARGKLDAALAHLASPST